MPPARRRPTQSFDPAIITRIEALSRELRDAVPNTSFVGRNGTQSVDCTADHHQSHVERRHDKREKKLDKLHEEVLRQQSETETLRENLDQSFRETSAHHTQFLQWYREKNRQIDAKYAKLGVRCPFVTGRGADAFTYPFRELDVTSPVTGKKTVHRSPVSIEHDASEGSPTMGLSPSPLHCPPPFAEPTSAPQASLNVSSHHRAPLRTVDFDLPTSSDYRQGSPTRRGRKQDALDDRVPFVEYAPHGCLVIATRPSSSATSCSLLAANHTRHHALHDIFSPALAIADRDSDRESRIQQQHIVAGGDVVEHTPARVHTFVDALEVQRSLFRTLQSASGR
jgi:hypothetical protein